MKHALLAVGVTALLALSPAVVQAQGTGMSKNSAAMNKSAAANKANAVSSADKQFLKTAIQIDRAEIKMGQLAQQKGSSQEVKQFGQVLVQDHQADLDKASSLAKQVNVQVPAKPNSQQQAEYDKLQKLSGGKFDQQFAQAMAQGHQKAISKFQKEAGKSGQIATYANETLPTLKKHLQMAQSLTKGGNVTGSVQKQQKQP